MSTERITFATNAPKTTRWGRVFAVWEEAIKKKTDGKLELQVFYQGSQGDDGAVVGKLQTGQLDAAAVTSIGLAKVHKPVLALQLPGLFRDVDRLEQALGELRPELNRAFEDKGFYVRMSALGKLRLFSHGAEVRRPSDLKRRKVLAWQNDVIGPTVHQVVGDVSTVRLSGLEVLPALKSKTVEVLSAPALAVEQLQWAPHLDHVAADTSVVALAGVLWSKKRIDALPGDLRTVLLDTGAVAAKAFSKSASADDDASFARLSTSMTTVTLSQEERDLWSVVFKKTRERLAQGTFDPSWLDRLEKLSH